jgi:hypothetical protein
MQQLPVGPVAYLGLILLGGISQSGEIIMVPIQGSAQDVDNARVALVLIVASVIFFGRAMLRVALAAIAVAVVVGAVVLLHGMHV